MSKTMTTDDINTQTLTSDTLKSVETDGSIAVRIDACIQAQRRSRLCLAILSFACAAMLGAVYNAYLSYSRAFVLDSMAVNPHDDKWNKMGADGRYLPMATKSFEGRRLPDIATEQSIKSLFHNSHAAAV